MISSSLRNESESDEISVGRIRRLSTTDAEEVIRAYHGGEVKKPKSPWKKSWVPLIAITIFCAVYMSPVYVMYPCARTCLAILALGGVLWATEIVPSYVTAYLMPIMCVWFDVGYDSTTGKRVPANRLSTAVCAKFTDPIIFVFLGSLTISAALAKLNITERVSKFAFGHISNKPNIVLLTLMLLNFTISGFLSNIAATTIFLTFSLPIIRTLDPDDPYAKALLFGLAWSGNAGGLLTTIASAQNILAIKYINESGTTSISFIEWIAFGGPTGVLCCIFFWVYLIIKYKPMQERITFSEGMNQKLSPWTWKHTLACATTVFTILLWAMQETFPRFLGHIGISSLIPIVVFFSTGILDSDDFGHLRWSTISLMGGGLALGEAMRLSGLLDLLADSITHVLKGIPLFWVMFIFLFIEAVLVSVINHTSAAAILFPVLNAIGEQIGRPNLMLILSAMMIGMAQLFYISSFATALVAGVQRHERGNPQKLESQTILEGTEFFLAGWPIVLGSVIIIGTAGYGIVYGLNI